MASSTTRTRPTSGGGRRLGHVPVAGSRAARPQRNRHLVAPPRRIRQPVKPCPSHCAPPSNRPEEQNVQVTADFNEQIIQEFHASQGRVGAYSKVRRCCCCITRVRSPARIASTPRLPERRPAIRRVCLERGALTNPPGTTTSRPNPTSRSRLGPTRSPCKPARRRAKNATVSFARRSSTRHSLPNTRSTPAADPVIILTPTETG